jgi:anti-sigma regulatory factor (Ser/Thr protein kinase)
MRSLLGVLRADGNALLPRGGDPSLVPEAGQPAIAERAPGEAELLPQPGLADLGRLVTRTAEAGVRVDLDVTGARRGLPAGLDLAAYRVIQEALTNVIKHAATDTCQVTLAYQEDALSLEITDTGRDRVPPDAAPGEAGTGEACGHGIAGMRERVAMYGGEFGAGPLPGHGFRIAARLPLGEPPLNEPPLDKPPLDSQPLKGSAA